MEVPFNGFELTFIIIAFVIFSLFSLASVCIQPQDAQPGTINRHPLFQDVHVCVSNAAYFFSLLEEAVYEVKKSQPSNKKQGVINKQARQKP